MHYTAALELFTEKSTLRARFFKIHNSDLKVLYILCRLSFVIFKCSESAKMVSGRKSGFPGGEFIHHEIMLF